MVRKHVRAGFLIILGLLVPRLGWACTISPYPSVRAAGSTHFIATATADTLHAGPGSVEFYAEGPSVGAPIRTPERPIYGQVVRISTVGGLASDTLQALADSGHLEAVIVPWAYGMHCRTTAWSLSARWVEPGATGFYVGRLRPREQWVGGRPTFDVGGYSMPYPHGSFIRRYLRRWTDPGEKALDVAEFHALYEALPLNEELERDPRRALRPLQRWEREHPELARRAPAADILQEAYWSLREEEGS